MNNLSFLQGADTKPFATNAYALFSANRMSPWSLETFVQSLNSDLSAVVCSNSCFVGFIIVSSVLDHADIEDICISEDHRNRGIAAQLLQHSIQHAQTQGIKEMFLEVAQNNQSAIALYQKLGFRQIGKRKAYYHAQVTDNESNLKGKRVDALLMQKSLKQ